MHTNTTTRQETLRVLFGVVPSWRLAQIDQALFSPLIRSFGDITTLPALWRTSLHQAEVFVSYKEAQVFWSQKKDTFKALLTLADDKKIETVLMKNARGAFTVCVSTQVGCAMACIFCATGKMGFLRNLSSDEIVDQVRHWVYFLADHPEVSTRISNIVYMGMGEPLANYEAVKQSLQTILKHTDIGPTHITVSTVGLVPMLEYILDDGEWPAVRLAVSLHSADPKTRKEIMPTSYDDFPETLARWAERYFAKFDSKRRHLTFEYIMLSGVNDSEKHVEALIRFARRIGKVRINLIPYNYTGDVFRKSTQSEIDTFQERLESAGVDVTRRRTMGEDIDAACGQLAVRKGE
ncbi:MAG: 23S rRNA (adenine(2503)-C(2))-methyltransferase RlmN [Candidatus Moranbacteria bacterium]|nr:23S rRNA (adenine(2503)-C(2))-methyltransferase RlmN [Candidatus Moranbacteria bacterium]